MGVFGFEAGIEHWIELSDQGDGGVVADAVYLVKKAQVYDSYSWAPSLPSAGDYAVYAKWAADAGRASDAVYGIYHTGGLAEVAQDQRAGAGQWRYLGTYAFDPAGSPLVVLAGGSDGTLSADAIRFVGAGPAPADLRFVLGDHLGTPQKLTDNTGALVWDRLQTPFGLDHSVTGPAATPVRFPGQYADAESSLYYNYFRDYDPSLGRYVQSDPIGLEGGPNQYLYVFARVIISTDYYGLEALAFGDNPGDGSNPQRVCPPVPFSPMREDVDWNIEDAQDDSYLEWYKKVRNSGQWDYKQRNPAYEGFGNFNYGATGRAVGIPGAILRRGAGWAQQRAGSSDPTFGNWWEDFPYGDDPKDQSLIDQGIQYFDNRCYDPCPGSKK